MKTEIRVEDLQTYGVQEFDGEWNVADTFTIEHPRQDEATPYVVLERHVKE